MKYEYGEKTLNVGKAIHQEYHRINESVKYFGCKKFKFKIKLYLQYNIRSALCKILS